MKPCNETSENIFRSRYRWETAQFHGLRVACLCLTKIREHGSQIQVPTNAFIRTQNSKDRVKKHGSSFRLPMGQELIYMESLTSTSAFGGTWSIFGANFLAHYSHCVRDSTTRLTCQGEMTECTIPTIRTITGGKAYHHILHECPQITRPDGT